MSPASGGPDFDAHADTYEDECATGLAVSGESKEYFARGRVRFLRQWWSEQRLPEPGRIVDLGCGLGDVTEILAASFPDSVILGIDQSEAMISRAIERCGQSRRLSFEIKRNPPRSPHFADLVHMNGVLHHVPLAERARFLVETTTLMKTGAIASIFDNNALNPGTRLVMSRIPFDRAAVPLSAHALRRLLHAAGLRVVLTRHLFVFPRMLSLLRPLELPLSYLPLGAQYAVIARWRPS